MDRTVKIILALILTHSILACSEQNTGRPAVIDDATARVTALEGKWKSQCFTLNGYDSFSTIINDTNVLSFRLEQIFKNTGYDVVFANYSDDTCSTYYNEIDPETAENAVQPYPIPPNFSIGKQNTTIEGDVITEIDFLLGDGSIKKDIFLLQNDTLYFGLPGTDCLYITSDEQYIICSNIRPETINFQIGYALNGKPVVTPFDPSFPSEPPPGASSNFDVTSLTLTLEPLPEGEP